MSIKIFKTELAKTKNKFIEIYGKDGHEKFSKEYNFAVLAAMNNNKLLICTPMSIFSAITKLAATDMTLNPLYGHASLIPRRIKTGDNKYEYQAILMPEYKGMIETILKSGLVKNLIVDVVYENDEYEIIRDTKEGDHIIHKPRINRPDGEKIIFAYSVAIFDNNIIDLKYLDAKKILKRRKKATTDVIWNEWEEEMTIKTMIRYHYKFLPKTSASTKVMELFDDKIKISLDNDSTTNEDELFADFEEIDDKKEIK